MSKRKDGFIKGAVIGTVLGGLAALLLAPKSGKETREDIKKGAKQIAGDLDARMNLLADELMGRIDDLKDAAKDLKGEALEESQGLIKRAEVLKQDLRVSSSNLARNGGKAKDDAIEDVKRMMDEGSAVMSELERVTKHVMKSAKERMKKDDGQSS